MPITARHLNMPTGQLFDARYDIVESTEGALNYLNWLHKELDGDWFLALAAYNAGLSTVKKAIRKNKKNKLPTDFWSLKLPKETMDYVPRLLAIQSLIDAPEAYGVTLADIPNKPHFISIGTRHAISLEKVANFLDVPKGEIFILNAGYRLKRTPSNKPNRLLLPERFGLQLTDHAIEELEIVTAITPKLSRHIVRKGDTLSNICAEYEVSIVDIRELNELTSDTIKLGQSLLVPRQSS